VTSEQRASDWERLDAGAKALGLTLPAGAADALTRYLELLEETNQVLNLTRIPRVDYVTLHLLDSLTCLLAADFASGTSVLDVGTGAGFPGIPIAAARPQCHVTLLDSTRKKLTFIETAAQGCSIVNCSFVHARAEAAGAEPPLKRGFDVVVSRAVAPFERLVDYVLPFVKRGGVALAMKASGYEEELVAAKQRVQQLGCSVERVVDVTLPETEIVRHIIVMRRAG
jgi:16S rRNA (guanine527-N7)-methyltransferase